MDCLTDVGTEGYPRTKTAVLSHRLRKYFHDVGHQSQSSDVRLIENSFALPRNTAAVRVVDGAAGVEAVGAGRPVGRNEKEEDVSEDTNCPHGVSLDDPCRACEVERLAAWTDEQREAAVAEAAEQALEIAHDIVVAAVDGDVPGMEALLKCLNIRLHTILNKGPLPWTDIS